jgi:hypothetical protein
MFYKTNIYSIIPLTKFLPGMMYNLNLATTRFASTEEHAWRLPGLVFLVFA